VSASVKAAVRQWWDDRTRPSANVHNTVREHLAPKQWSAPHVVHWQEHTNKALYKQFQTSAPSSLRSLSLSTFVKLKPFYVRPVGESAV
jgi:hypothetical protein